MSEPKTRRHGGSVADFLAAVEDPARRADARAACALMAEATGAAPAMWGTGIVGFGTYRYETKPGHEAEWPPVGLSPRKTALTLYFAPGFDDQGERLSRLGPHKIGKGCLYVKRLADVDTGVLREMVADAYGRWDGQLIRTARS